MQVHTCANATKHVGVSAAAQLLEVSVDFWFYDEINYVCMPAAEDKGTQTEIVREKGRRGELGLENALMDFVVRFPHFRFVSLWDSVPLGSCKLCLCVEVDCMCSFSVIAYSDLLITMHTSMVLHERWDEYYFLYLLMLLPDKPMTNL